MAEDKPIPASAPPAFLAWIIWGLGAALYFTGFYQRVAPAVMTDKLMADFGIGAAALGNLSAFYFYGYVAMQVPTGILADYWGPRRLLAAGSFFAAMGTFLFAMAPSIFVANMGRLLIGGSVGVAFVSTLKLAIHWFPPQRFAVASGLTLVCGIIGAVSAGMPLRILVEAFGWRSVLFVSAGLTLALAGIIWVFLRDDPKEKGYRSFVELAHVKPDGSSAKLLSGLGSVFRYRNTWLLSLAPSGVVGPVLAFSGLWGVPYLICRYSLSPAESAAITSTLLVTFAIGGPVLGGLSDKMEKRKPLYLAGCILSCAGWALALYVPGLSLWVFVTVLMVVGFASGAMVTGFAFAKESVPPSLGGTVSGVCNMGVMIGPMVLQPAIGWVLDRNWTGLLENGVRVYEQGAYGSAFFLMVGWSVVASILMMFTEETNCRQTQESADPVSTQMC